MGRLHMGDRLLAFRLSMILVVLIGCSDEATFERVAQ